MKEQQLIAGKRGKTRDLKPTASVVGPTYLAVGPFRNRNLEGSMCQDYHAPMASFGSIAPLSLREG